MEERDRGGAGATPEGAARVRTYLFVRSLAYWLEMTLRWKLLEGRVPRSEVTEYQERLLESLSRM